MSNTNAAAVSAFANPGLLTLPTSNPLLEKTMFKSALIVLSFVAAASALPIVANVDTHRVGIVDGVVGIAWVLLDKVAG